MNEGPVGGTSPARFPTIKVRNLKISIFIVVALWILAGLKLAGSFISL